MRDANSGFSSVRSEDGQALVIEPMAHGLQELGIKEVKKLLLDWLNPFLTVEDQVRLTGWRLGVRH